jgi:cytochrome c-type biogenesis protein CcmH
MIFWVLAGFLAAAAALALALTGRRTLLAAGTGDASLAIYKDQLAEVERDLGQGLLKPEEAEGQKAEVGRRLLVASREETSPGELGRAVPLAVVLLVPILAFGIYALQGAPQLPDVPHAQRIAMAQQTGDVEALLVQVEDHLAKHPEDATGWKLLVPSYLSLGRFNDAAAAIAKILQLEKPTADLYAELAEALTFANQGLMTENAEKAASEALKLDARNHKALYYEALSLSQKGNRAEAIAKFKALLASAPANAPWRAAVENQIRSLSTTAPALTDEQMKAAEGQTPEQRLAMIRGMVDGLEARLAENVNDLEGWLRLIRARTVLNEQEKAREALGKAKVAFANDAAATVSIDALAKELDLR